jgi:2-keto-4-pentenoate hydratase/2-oxohepta-3-ene-1,7-dioic acid hydratase in catechol pathway
MKIVRFVYQGQTGYGIVDGTSVRALEGDLYGDKIAGPVVAPVADIRPLAPVLPSKIICIGLNYRDHAAEIGTPLPESPLIFLKPPSAVIGPGSKIVYPPMSQLVHHEAELAVIIGREAKNVTREQALDYVLGYTCTNDVTARDIQRAQKHNTLSKAFDTFLPMGPIIATDLDPDHLRVRARVNGEVRQDSNTSNLVFNAAYLVSYLSQVMTLLPGDVISTGTPAGVGPLVPGDEVEIEVEGIGILRNTVVR